MAESQRIVNVLRRLRRQAGGGRVDREQLRQDIQALPPDDRQRLRAAVQMAATFAADAAATAADAAATRRPRSRAA